MANYSFSTKPRDTESTTVVDEIREMCNRTGMNFSALVITQLKKYHKEVLANGSDDSRAD